MAFKEVELTEEEKAAMSQSFFKFENIGDKLAGRFVKTVPASGKFAKPNQVDYVFKIKNTEGVVVETTMGGNADAAMKLKKAIEKGDLKPGYAVLITYIADLDVGKENPMKQFKVLVDDTPPKNAAPPPPPQPADDIDF